MKLLCSLVLASAGLAMLGVTACSSDQPSSAAAAPPAAPGPATGPIGAPAPEKPQDFALRTFALTNGQAVPMNIQSEELSIVIDNQANSTVGNATIKFSVYDTGSPYLLIDPAIRSARLDGKDVTVTKRPDPDNLNELAVVSETVAPGAEHTLELSYEMSSADVTYRTGGVGFVTAMADIADGNFFEKYGPSNFEFDQYQMNVELRLSGVTSQHQLFTNGNVTRSEQNSWRIEFPPYFTTSSFYFHVTDAELAVRRTSYESPGGRTIPITVYSQAASEADSAIAALPRLFSELESTYGAYGHPAFVAYISGAGGMEHSGATITSLSALGHELLHSWFGRGVMPSSGSAGWVDEAVASWRDNDYFTSDPNSSRSPVNLTHFSEFEMFTPFVAYAEGRQLLSELDVLFRSLGGLRPILAQFYADWRGKLIETDTFETYLEQKSGIDLTQRFERYVHGMGDGVQLPGQAPPAPGQKPDPGSAHPPSLTNTEIEALR